MVYAFLIDNGVDTSKMSPSEAIELYHEMTKKKKSETEGKIEHSNIVKNKSYSKEHHRKLGEALHKLKIDRLKQLEYNKNRLKAINNKEDKYIGVLERVKSFKGKEQGTYNFETGEAVSFDKGFQISFHRYAEDGSPYGRYNNEEYDSLTNKMSEQTGSNPYIGVFPTPEVSFWVDNLELAIKLGKENNQYGIYDWVAGDVIELDYNKSKNPLFGKQ